MHSVSVSSKLKCSLLKEIGQPVKFRKVGHSLQLQQLQGPPQGSKNGKQLPGRASVLVEPSANWAERSRVAVACNSCMGLVGSASVRNLTD